MCRVDNPGALNFQKIPSLFSFAQKQKWRWEHQNSRLYLVCESELPAAYVIFDNRGTEFWTATVTNDIEDILI